MKKQNARQSGHQGDRKQSNGKFNFGNSEVELQVECDWEDYPNCLLMDTKQRFALCTRNRKEDCSNIQPVTITRALRWYLHLEDLGSSWQGMPNGLLRAAVLTLEAQGN